MPDYSNARIRQIEDTLGQFVFEQNEEFKDEGLVTRGPYQLSNGAVYKG
jgi:hypothetical protein